MRGEDRRLNATPSEVARFRKALDAWRAVPHEEQLARLAGPQDDRLIVRGYADSSVGYGQMAGHLARALEEQGIPIAFEPIHLDEARLPLDPWVRSRLVGPTGRACLSMGIPETVNPPGSVALTMWESTRLPPGRADILNLARAVVVPCAAVAGWFRDSGVSVPIRVVPLGIDPEVYRRTHDEPPGIFRVGAGARLSHGGARKGIGPLVEAFVAELGDEPDAELIVKVWPDCDPIEPGHPRVRVDRSCYSDRGMADWYRSLSVYATLSHGEGWGLQPHQAMAVGRPAIASFWGGHAAYMTPESCYPVDFREAPGGTVYYAGNGDWCEPSVASFREQLRRAYEHPEERRSKGAAAADRAALFTWNRAGAELARVVRDFGLMPDVEKSNHHMDRLHEARSCDYRGPRSFDSAGCNCRWVCLMNQGDPIRGTDAHSVSIHQCLACRAR